VLLTTAGFQVPAMPFVEVVGKKGGVVPAQIGLMVAKVGVMVEFTVTVIVTGVAQGFELGVKV